LNKTDKMGYRPVRTSIDISGPGVAVHKCPAPADLAPYVEEFWQYKVSQSLDYMPMQVFPSGCVSLRFNIMPRRVDSVIYGPSTNNRMKALFFQEWVVFGATLRPDRAYHLLGLTLAELRDLRINLDCFWPRLTGDLEDQMYETDTFKQRVDLLATFLRKVLRANTEPSTDFLNTFQDLLSSASRSDDLSLTAKRHQISCRTMRRHFHQYLGLGPKQMERVLRAQGTMRHLIKSPTNSLSALSHDHGYSDQSHLTREFRDIVGLSPKRFASLVGKAHDKTLPEWTGLDPEWRHACDFKETHRFR